MTHDESAVTYYLRCDQCDLLVDGEGRAVAVAFLEQHRDHVSWVVRAADVN